MTTTLPTDLGHPLLDAAAGLVPLVEAHRAEGDATAQLPRPVLGAAGAAGMFRLFAPAEVGGHEAPLPVAAAVFELLSAIDPTLTWYMVNSGAAGFAAARLQPAERDELFAEPDRNFGYSAAVGGRATPTASGTGFRLSGEWPVVTGVLDARWCALSGVMADPASDGGPPDLRVFLVPTEVVEVDRIWDEAVAMRATGSHRVVVDDVELPAWCGRPLTTPLVIDRALFRLGVPVGGMAANAAIPTGILGGAVAAAAREVAARVSTVTGQAAVANPAVLELLADADAAHQALRSGLLAAAGEVWAAAQEGGRGTRQQRAAVHGLMHHAGAVAREHISRLYARSSRAAFFRGHPLERALRDIHAINYGLEPLRSYQHSAALVRLGLAPTAPGF